MSTFVYIYIYVCVWTVCKHIKQFWFFGLVLIHCHFTRDFQCRG